MPRRARITAAGIAHHVVQRGHNRRPTFFAAEDYQNYPMGDHVYYDLFNNKDIQSEANNYIDLSEINPFGHP